MVILGLLALVQLTFLPGAIVLRLLRFKGLLRGILIAFGLSPLINFQLAFILTALGLYRRGVLLALCAMEIAALIFLSRQTLALPLRDLLRRGGYALASFWRDFFGGPRDTRFALGAKITAFALAMGCLGWYGWMYGRQYNEVFTIWDAIVSWDRWALDWYQGRLPTLTWQYPQVIPTSWSLTYLFVNDSIVKQFARWWMAWFEVFIPLSLFIMGWLRRSSAYFWCCSIAAILVFFLGARAQGNVDTAVACLSLIAVECLLLSLDETDARQKFLLLLFGLLIACAAGLTKQGGLWTVMIYPVLYGVTTSPRFTPSISRRQWLVIVCLALLMLVPWYTYKQAQIMSSADRSIIHSITTDAHLGRNLIERADYGLSAVQNKLGVNFGQFIGVLTLTGILTAAALKVKTTRWIVLLIVIPYFIIWLFVLSYDERNLTHILPFVGLAAGFGLDWGVRQIGAPHESHA